MTYKATKEEREIFARLGREGGKTTKERYGKNHFKEMAKKRWEKVKAEKEPVDKK